MRHSPTPFEREVVVRRIDRPLATLALPEPTTLGALRLTDPFTIDPTALTTTWRAPALVHRTRVEVELAEWSDRTTELRIRPLSRHLSLRGERWQRRYFGRTHEAADALADHLRCRTSVRCPDLGLQPRNLDKEREEAMAKATAA
jgi:hypothetical protein